MENTEAQVDNSLLNESQPETTSQWYSKDNADVVERAGWKSADDAIQSYRNMEKMSSGKVKMPTPESSAEEIRAFYQKTGCPENPDGYELQIPEEMGYLRDELLEGEMKKIAFAEGVSKQAFESIVKNYYDSQSQRIVKETEAAEVELRQQHGDKYGEVIKVADRFLNTCSPEFCEIVKVAGLGRNPVFINEWYAKGKQTMSDTLIKGVGDGDEENAGFVPQYKTSPEMYASGEDEDSIKSRAYFTARGHKY